MLVKMRDVIPNSSRIPFTKIEKEALVDVLLTIQEHGGVLKPLINAGGSIDDLLVQGVVILSSALQLHKDYMFLKLSAGRKLFGRQKAVYASYIGDRSRDEFTESAVFESWLDATTSIGHFYREMQR